MEIHYLVEGPSCINFSGGRTSGYMLRRILDAHGGKLPENTHVLFANTGKERPETLDFVNEVSERWRVPVRWIEWQREDPGYREVSYETACRKGEPFDALIEWKQMLPNPLIRLCTQHLKIDAMRCFIGDQLWKEKYTTFVGIRYDEPKRFHVLGQDKRNAREFKVGPLVDDQITEEDVMAFWKGQPFDLHLKQGEGNCDLCFMKRSPVKHQIIRDRPDLADWWAAKENPKEGTKWLWRSNGMSYRKMIVRAKQTSLPIFDDGSEVDCACTD